MPIPFIAYITKTKSEHFINNWKTYAKVLTTLACLGLFKLWTSGAKNTWERKLNGMVVMVTGGTSGIGKTVVEFLAKEGAQVVILLHTEPDEITIEQVMSLRKRTNNQLIYTEVCDLSSMLSVRKFATKWIDAVPVRRLDMVILCSGYMQPPFSTRQTTKEGIEWQWAVNFLGPYQLLRILRPAIVAQPAHREVRIISMTCSAYVIGDLDIQDLNYVHRPFPSRRPWRAFGAAKLALMSFLTHYQVQMVRQERPDKLPSNVHTIMVDPGLVRTPGLRLFLSLGTVWGLILYLLTWPIWWLFLKGTNAGAQSVLNAICSPQYGMMKEPILLRECSPVVASRKEMLLESFAEKLEKAADKQIAEAEAIYKKNKAKTGAKK
ncbi:short chain dehydrogenase [Schizosaccharomyces japonicus yFS275]|uniref:Short chain dehydrogenase n=1 Tax=Schizosaccharomyces japonicus (strain yFS275 / FY16936) TaxID=402676 RepID=B6K3R0_SCHJY|nr:short chain dehydrogenase [Schizosaccharomyces japonicus yFS275]EEB08117.1 short chain dehydrogenase [Schizosaccharomyces japonicus yFS275]